MRWLITGGAGFVGSNLAARRLRMGDEVTIFDNYKRPGSEKNLAWLAPMGAVNCIGNVCEAHAIAGAVNHVQPDVVVHLAAQVAVTTSLGKPVHDCLTNVLGTVNVLEAVRLHCPSAAVLFASTNKVYGCLNGTNDPVDEGQPLDPCTPYGVSKAAAECYVRDYARTFGLKTTVFRMSCIYGNRQWGNEDQGWVAHFAFAAKRGEPVIVYGDGTQVRDLLWIDDWCEAAEKAIEQSWPGQCSTFNVGGGIDNTLSVARCCKALGLTLSFADERPGDQRYYVSEIGNAIQHLGWSPKVGIGEGLERLKAWVDEAA